MRGRDIKRERTNLIGWLIPQLPAVASGVKAKSGAGISIQFSIEAAETQALQSSPTLSNIHIRRSMISEAEQELKPRYRCPNLSLKLCSKGLGGTVFSA